MALDRLDQAEAVRDQLYSPEPEVPPRKIRSYLSAPVDMITVCITYQLLPVCVATASKITMGKTLTQACCSKNHSYYLDLTTILAFRLLAALALSQFVRERKFPLCRFGILW